MTFHSFPIRFSYRKKHHIVKHVIIHSFILLWHRSKRKEKIITTQIQSFEQQPFKLILLHTFDSSFFPTIHQLLTTPDFQITPTSTCFFCLPVGMIDKESNIRSLITIFPFRIAQQSFNEERVLQIQVFQNLLRTIKLHPRTHWVYHHWIHEQVDVL